MEHAQRFMEKTNMKPVTVCLNPYFNGTCSKIEKKEKYNA